MTGALVWGIGAMVAERERQPQPLGSEDGLYGVYFVLNQIREELERQGKALEDHEREVTAVLRGDKNNGEKGLSWRMRDVERDIAGLKTQADRIEAAINLRGIATETGRWSMAQAVIVAILTGIFLLGVAVVSGVFRGKP